MTPDSDILIDRRRLARRLALWRIVAIVALAAVAVVAVGRFDTITGRDHLARVTIDGLIVDDPDIVAALVEVAEDSRAKALIVRIDSPGGTFVGGETLYRALREVAEGKPVVAVLGTVATSAAYMAAVATDHIFARQGTITGSIGVMMQTADMTGLLDKLGISAEAIKSGPLKAAPSPLEPLTDEVRAATQAIVDDMHALFTDMVAERRGFDAARARRLADGRVYSGRQALEHDLIDAIGGETEARAWLVAERGLPEGLPVNDVDTEPESGEWFPGIRSLTRNLLLSERLTLDGLISVWHLESR